MGILHDIVYAVRVGKWQSKKKLSFEEADIVQKKLTGVITGVEFVAEKKVDK